MLIILLIGMFPSVASAQGYRLTNSGWNCTGFLYCGSGTNIVFLLSQHIIVTVSAFIVTLTILVIAYGALRLATSQGQEGKEAGKKAIMWASLGLVAAMLTGAIIQFVTGYLYMLGG
jgi:hypothetical protein